MHSALTAERVRRDIEVLARAGLDTATFVTEMVASLQRALPADGVCVATVDPATNLLTGTYKFGDLAGQDSRDAEWGELEYGNAEPDSFLTLAQRPQPVAGVVAEFGEVARSLRMREFIVPHFGYADEMRLIARDGRRSWGAVALFRSRPDQVFDDADLEFAATLSQSFAQGLRAGLLVRLSTEHVDVLDAGPAVIIVDQHNRMSQASPGASARLQALADGRGPYEAEGIMHALVAHARRYAAGHVDTLPRTRIRLRNGQWLVLHASPLSGPGGTGGDVVVTVDVARPPEIIPLVVEAFDLTPREQEVVGLVIQGVDTKEIAKAMHLSAYTVQDHLKSIFEKADVRSRRELMARIFFDQYLPRIGQDLDARGWFSPAAN